MSFVWSYFGGHLFVWCVLALAFAGTLAFIVRNDNFEFVDCLFLATSAITANGLCTVNFHDLRTEAMVFVCIIVLIGGTLAESVFPILIRLLRDRNVPATTPLVQLEREALWLLLRIILFYFVITLLVTWLGTSLWFEFSEDGRRTMSESGVNAWWFSLFTSVSGFQNGGFSMLKGASFTAMNQQALPLVLFGLCFLAGNAYYPILLRWLLILHLKYFQYTRKTRLVEVTKFILDHPRQVNTHLFRSTETWILCGITTLILFLSTFLTLATDWKRLFVFGRMNGFMVFLNSWFQSVNTHTTGYSTIDIAGMSIACQIQIMMQMYFAHYPYAVVMHSSNENLDIMKKDTKKKLIYQVQKLILWDLVCVILPWYIIAAIEGGRDEDNGFCALFEVITAYGTVGLTMGNQYNSASYSAFWKVPSKVILIAVMILGRHRALARGADAALSDQVLMSPDNTPFQKGLSMRKRVAVLSPK